MLLRGLYGFTESTVVKGKRKKKGREWYPPPPCICASASASLSFLINSIIYVVFFSGIHNIGKRKL